jgi:hypothetical protein
MHRTSGQEQALPTSGWRSALLGVSLKPAIPLPAPKPTIVQSEILRFPGAFPGVEILNLSHVGTHSKITPISG